MQSSAEMSALQNPTLIDNLPEEYLQYIALPSRHIPSPTGLAQDNSSTRAWRMILTISRAECPFRLRTDGPSLQTEQPTKRNSLGSPQHTQEATEAPNRQSGI